jgi:hypothetical protein
MTLLEQQVEITWAQLAIAEQELLWARRPLWRKLLRRPPKGASKEDRLGAVSRGTAPRHR